MRASHRVERTAGSSLTSLLVPEGLARSLASFIVVISVLLASLGSYQLIEAVHHPLEAQTAGILGAAVMITLSAVLLFPLLVPWAAAHSGHRRRHSEIHRRPVTLHAQSSIPSHRTAQSDLPFGVVLAERSVAGD